MNIVINLLVMTLKTIYEPVRAKLYACTSHAHVHVNFTCMYGNLVS